MTMLLRVSKPGFDAKTTAKENLRFSSEYPMFKIKSQGSGNIKMYAVDITTDVEPADTTIHVASTANLHTAGQVGMYGYKILNLGGTLYHIAQTEEISYTGKTATTLTGCTRGLGIFGEALYADASDANNYIVNLFRQTAIDHGLTYPPAHEAFRNDSTEHILAKLPNFFDEFGVDRMIAKVDSDYLYVEIDWRDGFDFIAGTAIVPTSGNYKQYDYLYTIFVDSILTPYY
jgi:hypothetical protein